MPFSLLLGFGEGSQFKIGIYFLCQVYYVTVVCVHVFQDVHCQKYNTAAMPCCSECIYIIN